MKSSFPLAAFSELAKACLVEPRLSRQFSEQAGAASRNLILRHRARRAAFTLIELLVVVSIVAILAGLVLSTLGYVNRKGAASRAESEVAALSAAIESYKLDIGSYPDPSNLYSELTAGGPVNTDKVYFEPTGGMVNTNGKSRTFQDPYGNAYNYTTNATRNIGFFDLWSVPPTAESEADWIHN
ncbi:MAG: type II secretion system protein [Chthoniobacterales bacterium]